MEIIFNGWYKMTLTEEVEAVLNSNLSNRKIGMETDVSTSIIRETRNGTRKVENMTLKTAEKIGKFYKTFD